MENNNYKSILFVEGKSDALFISNYLDYLFKEKNSVNILSIALDDFGGSDKKLISYKIRSNYTNFLNNSNLKNVGIVLDIDDYSFNDRLSFLNEAVQDAARNKGFDLEAFTKEKNCVKLTLHKTEINFSYFFIKDSNEQGNLESLLRNIVTQNPTAANCLEEWKKCSTANGVKIKPSDFAKFWKEVYVRYDYCSNKELAKHAVDNCTFEKSLDNMLIEGKPKAWNFEHETLTDLKQYLTQFQ